MRGPNLIVTLGKGLQNLISDELLAHAAHEGEQAEIYGPTVRLQRKVAETFALAVHELTTNSVTYGALTTTPGGSIHVSWNAAACIAPSIFRSTTS